MKLILAITIALVAVLACGSLNRVELGEGSVEIRGGTDNKVEVHVYCHDNSNGNGFCSRGSDIE
jgi:hypothetical protein